MISHITLGKWGEDVAVIYLKKINYRIVERNYRCKFGEIDIIALEGQTIVFVEVKTRSSGEFGCPQTGVTPRKQRQLTKIAHYYLQKHQLFHRDARFDVVAVEKRSGEKQITMIRNAFEVTDRVLSRA